MNFLKYVQDKLKITIVGTYNVKKGLKYKRQITINITGEKTKFKDLFIFTIVVNLLFCFKLFYNTEYFISSLIVSHLILAILITVFYIRRKNFYKNNQPKVKNINIYNRELPANLTPAHVRILIEDGKIDSYTIASTILDLIDKGYLAINSSNKNDLFTKNITLSLTTKPRDDLFTYEKYLINWFFDKPQITSEELKRKLNKEDLNPGEKFSIFAGLIILSFPLTVYFKKNNLKNQSLMFRIIASLFCGLLLLILMLYPNTITYSAFLLLFCILGFPFDTYAEYLLNEKGTEIKDEYLDLKKYLEDFSLIDKKTAEMIYIWNFYLSYSIALGINGITKKEIESFFGDKIYNLNSVYYGGETIDTENTQKYIDQTDNIIEKDKQLYQTKQL